MKDDEKTWVPRKRDFYVYLGFGEVKKDNSSLRKLTSRVIDPSWIRKFDVFYNRVGSISIYSTFNFSFDSICTRGYPRTGKLMGFTP